MTSLWEKAGDFWRNASALLLPRRDTAPIDNVAGLQEFVATRSAYVAQKTLFGYVKARMGSRYPHMFEDEKIIASLNIAKLHVFAACLSDLTVYTVAVALHDPHAAAGGQYEMARRCFAAALRENTRDAPEQFSVPDCIQEFDGRLADTDWQFGARQPENFTRSPRALFRWAPIADQLKRYDGEIIENSMKFAWRDIRQQFNKRLDAGAVAVDWGRQSSH